MGVSPTRNNDQRGAAVVEFSLIVVVMLSLMFGIVEIGRFVWTHQSLSAASREASRYGVATGVGAAGVAQYRDCGGMRAEARRRVPDLTLADADIVVTYVTVSPATTVPCPASGILPPSVVLKSGDRVKVSVQRRMDVNLPLVPLPDLPVTASDERTLFLGRTS